MSSLGGGDVNSKTPAVLEMINHVNLKTNKSDVFKSIIVGYAKNTTTM